MMVKALLLAGVVALASMERGPVRPRAVPGLSYTIRLASSPRGGDAIAATVASAMQSWTGHVAYARGRGRMDIVEGELPGLFEKGDYLLFDSTEFVVVHPAAKEFVALAGDFTSKGLEGIQNIPGIKLTVSNATVTMDSLGPGETLDARPTRHYRMNTRYTMGLDAGFMQQSITTESVVDYLVATVAAFPPNPLFRLSSMPASSGLFQEIATKVSAAVSRFGGAVPIKMTTMTRVMTGTGGVAETEQSMDVTNIRAGDVDETLLVLPAEFRQTSMPGMEELSTASGDNGAKWKARPAAKKLR